jgi:hypothetical protein
MKSIATAGRLGRIESHESIERRRLRLTSVMAIPRLDFDGEPLDIVMPI